MNASCGFFYWFVCALLMPLCVDASVAWQSVAICALIGAVRFILKTTDEEDHKEALDNEAAIALGMQKDEGM